MKVLFPLFVPLLLTLPALSWGQEIYRSVDAQGRVVFSNKAQDGAKPARLPTVTREDFDLRLKTLKESLPQSCESHGNVDCTHGADVDGSVICTDGFRNASALFSELCTSARLAEGTLEIFQENGTPVARPTKPGNTAKIARLLLTLRNQTSVPARGVKAKLRFQRKEAPTDLIGPETIEPFSAGEYTFTFPEVTVNYHQFSGWILKVTCENCVNYLDVLP